MEFPGRFKAIGLASKEGDYIKLHSKFYPFSYSTALYCIKRLLQRKVHSTLTCEDEVNAVHVLLFFMKLYKNFAPKSQQVSGLAGIIEVPFTPTIPKIPEDLIDSFNKAFEATRNFLLGKIRTRRKQLMPRSHQRPDSKNPRQ